MGDRLWLFSKEASLRKDSGGPDLNKVICVAGPTASGKTSLAIDLALALNGEIVSCDSMQIYRGMDIGTAKPDMDERKGIPHHMMDIADPTEDYSVARYVEEASRCIDDIFRRGKVPVVVGGTGLYMDALIKGLYFSNGTRNGILRKRIEDLHDRFGGPRLYRHLKSIDPGAADKIHPNDRKRLCRALEVYYGSERSISAHNEETRKLPPRYNAVYIGLDYKDRQILYSRINDRVDQMFQMGLVEEVKRLLNKGELSATASQAIGYKEIIAAINENLPLESATEEIKRATRRYAKRQLTWFRRNPRIIWFHKDLQKYEDILQASTEYFLRSRYNNQV
jgi:tRNA dimethylallyltransferase